MRKATLIIHSSSAKRLHSSLFIQNPPYVEDLPLSCSPSGGARGGRKTARSFWGSGWGVGDGKARADIDSNQSAILGYRRAERIPYGILPPVHASREQSVATPQVKQRKGNKKQTANTVCFLFGSPCWTRTSDTLINSQVLYRLS